MFVGIAGIIGAGKTTLTESLAEEYGFTPYHEPVEENSYLQDFYEDPNRWAAMMQMHLLSKRFEQHQQIVWNSSSGKVVQDRTIYEDTIFAKILNEDGLISDREYQTYRDHFNIMRKFLVYPDVIVYLDVSPREAMNRVKTRGRSAEDDMDLEYLERLEDGYQDFVKEMKNYTSVVEIDWEDYKPTKHVHSQIKKAVNSDNSQHKRSLRRI